MFFTAKDFAPPLPPVEVSEPTTAARMVFLHFPAGMVGDFHPAPTRQFCVVLSGEVRGTISDGESLILRPGEVIPMEDTTGRGHAVEVVGGEDVYLAMTQLE